MIGIAISKDGTVINKEVYAGDTSKIEEQIKTRQVASPDLIFDIYDDSKMADFAAIEMKSVPDKSISGWQAAKKQGTDEAISYLAKQLGLE